MAFSAPVNHRRIGNGWASWSHGYTGDVYYTNGATSLTMTMPAETAALYFYVEPDTQSVFDFTATTQDGTTSGSVGVNGLGGAKYFGFYGVDGMTIESVTVTTTDDFAVGEFGICKQEQPVPTVTALSDVHAWIGIWGGPESGASLDVMTELLENGNPVASGLARCVTVSNKPWKLTEVLVPWNAFDPVPLAPGDVLAIRFSARVGTNPDDSKCTGPEATVLDDEGVTTSGHSHSQPIFHAPVKARLYYDAEQRPSRFDITVSPEPDVDLLSPLERDPL